MRLKWLNLILFLTVIGLILMPATVIWADTVTIGTLSSNGNIIIQTNADVITSISISSIYAITSYIVLGNPELPSQMYTELNTGNIPGADIIAAIFGVSETPISLFWFPFVFIGIAIVSLLIYELTTSKGTAEGSLLTQFIVIEALLILFGVLGTANVGGLIPLWPAFLYPIWGTAWIMSRKHFTWG